MQEYFSIEGTATRPDYNCTFLNFIVSVSPLGLQAPFRIYLLVFYGLQYIRAVYYPFASGALRDKRKSYPYLINVRSAMYFGKSRIFILHIVTIGIQICLSIRPSSEYPDASHHFTKLHL